MSSVGKDLDHFVVLGIRQDALEPLAFRISSELIDRQHFRQLSCLEIDLIDDLCHRGRGHVVICRNILDASAFLQLFKDLQIYPVRELTVSWEKVNLLIKTLAALRTDMTSLTQMQDRIIAADGDVPDQLCPVIMNLAGDSSAFRAVVQALLHP